MKEGAKMEKNTIIFNGNPTEAFIEKNSVKILYLLGRQKKLKYKDNPPVAAVMNGELKSLQAEITNNAVIDLVYLDSKEGRRVYRKTLCFLLSYASAVLYPDRTLITGHALGDGFYFSYRNKEKADVKRLKEIMQEAIKDDMQIEIETLSEDQSLEHVRAAGLKETEKLILSRNDGAYSYSRLGKCLSLNYEPLLPSLRYLEIWDLMEYQDGLLLRFPQSREMNKLMPFVDNPLLFKVFSEAKEKAEILGVTSIGSLNEKQAEGKIAETIMLSETLQRENFSKVAKTIDERGGIKLVLVAGPASSGKKTFGLRLSANLKILGYSPIMLSVDDYKKANSVTMDDIDKEQIKSDILTLLEGKALFNPQVHRRFFDPKSTIDKDKTIIILEGIQSLKEDDYQIIKKEEVFKVYVSALTQLNLDTRCGISTTDNRLLRRLVSTCLKTGQSAKDVLLSWPKIEAEEKEKLFPFQNQADIMVNSALEYELGVLYVYAIPLLRSVKPEHGDAYTQARRLMNFLKLVYPIPTELVPRDSILREFIGGGEYSL